jgi:copper homeostasis protein
MCTASEGVDQLKQLRKVAAGRIEIVAAGGIRASNVRSVTARSGCRQIHSAVRELAIDLSTRHNPSLSFALPGTPAGSYGQASELQLTQLLEAVVDLRTGPTDAHISRVIV